MNTGDGKATTSRAKFSTQLSSVSSYTLSKILGSTYTDWVDTKYLS
jgi:pectinesterase